MYYCPVLQRVPCLKEVFVLFVWTLFFFRNCIFGGLKKNQKSDCVLLESQHKILDFRPQSSFYSRERLTGEVFTVGIFPYL